MSKRFRPWLVDQPQFLPPSIDEFVAPDHVAHFVRNLVREQLDLSAILASYTELRGYPPFDPRMMTAVLLYGYSRGVYSSRRLSRACEERLDFLAVTARNQPDFRTISEFRRRHLGALSELFVQVLRLCQKAGLVDLGHVALDGTKMKANASKHKAMSYGRMKKTEPELAAEVAAWLAAAEAADAQEDGALGDKRGDEMPAWVADKAKRLEKIRAAKAALEAEAKAQAETKAAMPKRYRGGRKPKTEPGTPPDKAQRNFTDPQSRIMKGRDGFIQGYNAQAAVDAKAQVILAHGLSDCAADSDQLTPHGGCRDRQYRVQAGAGLRRCRPLLGSQYPGHGRSPDRRLHRDWTAKARPRRTGWRRGPAQRAEGRSHARAIARRRFRQSIPAAKADRRAGLRPDQASQRLPPVPDARSRQGLRREARDAADRSGRGPTYSKSDRTIGWRYNQRQNLIVSDIVPVGETC